MTTNKHTAPNEVSVAFAEIDRLERDRAAFAAAKLETRTRLERSKGEIGALRERLEDERPHAWARVRRAQLAARALRERAAAEALAAVEVEHAARLREYHSELEARRLRLATLESMPADERPTRRLLEWSVPAAATALVAVFAFAFLGSEHEAEAHLSEQPVVSYVELERTPTFPDSVAPYALEREAPPAPVAAPVEAEPKSKTKSKAKSKAKSKSKAKAKSKSTPKAKPVTPPRQNKLILGNDTGNPLG